MLKYLGRIVYFWLLSPTPPCPTRIWLQLFNQVLLPTKEDACPKSVRTYAGQLAEGLAWLYCIVGD